MIESTHYLKIILTSEVPPTSGQVAEEVDWLLNSDDGILWQDFVVVPVNGADPNK